MSLFIRFVAVGFLLFLGGCVREAGPAPVSGPRESAIRESWGRFQRALRKPDVSEIASMTRFPLENNVGQFDDFKGLGSRATFERYFPQIFWDGVLPVLMNYQPTSAELEAGEWSVSYSERTGDTESGVIYGFKCSPDGKVWLTSVFFAG